MYYLYANNVRSAESTMWSLSWSLRSPGVEWRRLTVDVLSISVQALAWHTEQSKTGSGVSPLATRPNFRAG